MPNPTVSPLRYSTPIAPLTLERESLTDNAFASPFTKSVLRAVDTDVAGAHRQAMLEAQLAQDDDAARAEAYNLERAKVALQRPMSGPQTWDEASASGNYGDYVQNALGNAVGSMAKPLIASGGLGLVGGVPGSVLGSLVGSASAIRNAELVQYMEDPQLASLSAKDQLEATRKSALLQAIPEAILPAYIGAGGKLPGALSRMPGALRLAGEVATEAGTEGLQDYLSQRTAQGYFPDRQMDWDSVRENAIQGAIGGGGLGLAMHHDAGHSKSDALSRQAEAAAARTPPPEPGIDPNAPVDLGGPDAPGGGFGEGFTAGMDAVRGVKDDLVAKAKDGLDEVLNRTSEARAAGLEGMDFAREVFRPTLAERAASDALPENEDPAVQSAPDIEAALRDRPTRLAANAASFADELLARTDLPKAVRAKIESMGGNYADPVNQKYLTTFALGSDFQDSLTEGIEGLKALGRRVSGREKHNLQDISEVDAQPLVALLAQRLGPDLASDAPKLARQLLASSVRLNPSAGVSEEADAKLRKFSSVVDDDVLDTISQLTGTDELRGVLGNIRNLPGAEADVRRSNGGSFLESMLLQPSLPAGSLPAVARYVDEAVKKLEGASPQYKANLLEPLSKVVADPEAVLDYYGKLRADRTKLEASKDKNYSSAMSTMSELFDDMPEATEDPTYEGAASAAEWGAINEEDQSNNTEYGFREVATKRPFRKFVAEELSGGKRRTEAMRAINDARGRIGDADYRTMPYGDYLQQVENVAPEEGVARIKADIQKRIKNHLSHKGEDRTQQVNELEGELQLLEYNTKKENAKYALDQYEVTTRSRRKSMDNVATDDDIKAMKTALKVKGDEKGRTEEDVAPTRVEFRMVDGKSLVLSAESMIKTLAIKRSKQQGKIDSPNKEGSKQLFADAVASVLAREDVADLVTDLNKVQLSREGNKPLVRKPRSEERRASQQALEDIMEGTPVGVPARRARIRRLASILDRLINKYGVEDELVQRTMDYIEGLHSMAQAEFVAAKHAASVVRAKLGEKSNVSMRSLKYRLADLKAEGIAIPKIFDKAKTDADIQLAASLFLQNLIAKQDVAQSANEDYRNAYYAARETIKEAKQELAGDKLEDEGGEIASFSAAKPAGEISRSDEARRTGHTELRDDGKGSHAGDIEPTKRERLQAELDTIKRLANKPGTTEEQKAELRERWAEVSAALKAAGETTVAEGFDEAMRKAADPTVRGKAVPAKASYTDAVLAANPELLTVLNRFGEPKDKGWAEAEIRKRVYNAYAKLQTTPLKARLEALRKKYSEARAAGNEQEAKTVQHIGELIKHVLAARGVANNAPRTESRRDERVVLPKTSPYTAKDQAKSDKANKFIGRGAPGSSTAAYAKAWGDRANTGEYSPEDSVFISVNGNRPGALTPPWPEIKKAMSAGATLITDVPADRNRSFNTGERAVADFLDGNGYFEESPGTWVRGYDIDNATGQKRFAPLGKQRGDATTGASGQRIRKNSFVGAKADPEGATKASDALDVGQSVEAVWSQLGWFRGPDGKMRKEIRSPILKARIRELLDTNDFQRGVKLNELFDGVPGFEAYVGTPLGEVLLIQDESLAEQGFAGAFFPEADYVGLTRNGARLAVLIDRAGPKMLAKAAHWGARSMADFSDMLVAKLKVDPVELDKAVEDKLLSTALHEIQHAIQREEGFENGGTPDIAVVTKYGRLDEYLAAMKSGDYFEMASVRYDAIQSMLAEIGPDADPEKAAHDLYLDIVGEAEAHDVEARMELTDEEAKGLAPALTDAKREFLRSVVNMIALSSIPTPRSASKHRMKTTKQNRQSDDGSFDEPDFGDPDFGPEKRDWKGRTDDDGSFDEPDWSSQNRQTTVGGSRKPPNAKEHAELKKKLIDEIRRIRGNDVRVRFNRLIKQLGASGEFSMNADKTDRLIEVAVNAADPMGVAWHESLHDFFAMLGEDRAGRSIKRDLTNAANAPHVKRQLEKLLAAHPKALEQIKNDPEERIAYMYQFWAAGELNIGPTGTNIFQKLRQFFFDMFKIATSDQRAEDILTAFHEGKFADERVVAEVLADLPRDTVRNRIERFSPTLSDFLHATAQIAPDRLRDFQNEEISALADKLEQLVRRRFQQQGVWENKLADILAGTTAVERRAAVENMQARKDPSSPLEKKLAEFYKGMYDYMSKSGVETYSTKDKKWMPLRQVGDYFPRSWDPAAIQKDPQGFIALLAKHGNMSPAASKKLIDAIVAGDGRLELAEDEHSLGFTPFAKAAIDRQLTFINKANAADFAKYQQKDLMDITSTYIRQAVHRAEYAKLFENDGSGLAKHIEASGITDKKDLEAIDNSIRAMEGTLNQDKLSLGTKNLMSGAMTLQNITLLPLAIFSQSIDPIVMAARTGDLKDAGNAYVTALKRLRNFVGKSKDKVPGEELAEMLGIISQDSVLEAMGYAYGSTYMNRPLTKINRTFFKWNGMQGWNNSMRIAATVAGEKYLLANRSNAKALEELGLEPSDIQVLQAYNNGVRGEGLDYSNPKIREAMYQFVDQAVLRPSAANRPVWMSDPRFQLVAHLKQFTFAMHNVVLKRATQQADEGNHVPWAILGLTMPVILAADMAKFALTGTMPANWGFTDYLVHSVERSGILGLGDFSVQATRGMDAGAAPGEGLLGPTLENLFKILRWAGGDPRVKFEDVLDRTVPGAKFV